MKPGFIDIHEYSYGLPDERIAMHPLSERDEARLLVWKKGNITHHIFRDLPDLLPQPCTLFFNETRVIPARFFFEKTTGSTIEVLLLHPESPSNLFSKALSTHEPSVWKCTIGNLKRWSGDTPLTLTRNRQLLTARLLNRTEGLVDFSWHSDLSFAEVIQVFGEVPLPPYIKRQAEASDKERYQTVYSNTSGAVAAPTAGLHFTRDVIQKIGERKLAIEYLTLHVGAGTFLPVKVKNAVDHTMHSEQILIRKSNVLALLKGRPVVAVGTTALRTLESIYWYGARLLSERSAPFYVDSFYPYHVATPPPIEAAFDEILFEMDRQKIDELTGETSIYILPGYNFKVCDGLITNFHQPGSTLLLLIAAFLGPVWKKIYHEALENDYRFLSYGDSSLLIRDNSLIV